MYVCNVKTSRNRSKLEEKEYCSKNLTVRSQFSSGYIVVGDVVVEDENVASQGIDRLVIEQQECQISKYVVSVDNLTGRACPVSSLKKA